MSGVDGQVEMDILVIDDDPKILESIENYLRDRGHRVYLAGRGEEGLGILKREAVDIVITDVRMPGMDGFEVLRETQRISPGTEVIIITGYKETENAFRAVREGAFDFFTKPLRIQDLSASLQRTLRFKALQREKARVQERLDRLGEEVGQRHGLSEILGESPAIRLVKEQVRQVCRTESTSVLITGETGSGKELVARAIHAESARADGPFVAVDCSALPESLSESAFYGHERGAFTDARDSRKGYFEQADGGTLFLDEIGDMAPGMQTGLLRTLEERRVRRIGASGEIPVDVRVISATNRDLPEAIARGDFREDLLYRLNTVSIRVPPLRERPEDTVLLAGRFLRRYARELRKRIDGFAPEAVDMLNAHPFPGNVRELRNMVERAVIFCLGRRVTPDDLGLRESGWPAEPASSASPTSPGATPESGAGSSDPLDLSRAPDLNLTAFEKALVREALYRSEGNLSRAARLLGISREVLRTRMRNLGLTADR